MDKAQIEIIRTGVMKAAERPLGITLRAMISSIPILGSAASFLVERSISEWKSTQIHAYISKVARIEQLIDIRKKGSALGFESSIYSEALFIKAADAAARAKGSAHAETFASILFLDHEIDKDEVLRDFFVEVCDNLSHYEFALLIQRYSEGGGDERSDFYTKLFDMNIQDERFAHVREFSLNRLQMYQLIRKSEQDYILTNVGLSLVRAIA